MDTKMLDQRKIVVTGGLGALGRQVGAFLAARGAQVVLVDRAASAVVPDVRAVLGNVDLTDATSTAAAFSQAAQTMAGLNGLVNVAGGFAWEKIEGGQLSTWDRLYAMNLKTAVVASEQALPHLTRNKTSCIVNVGALAAQKAATGMAAYAASKAGVARLTEAMAEEFKDRGLRVNAVLPSIIDTPANRADMPAADVSQWVTPAELAAVIAFLLSDQASAVTGACIPVAGRL